MKNSFTLLIADRNPNVRDFLRREMTAEGYQVLLAKSGREVLDVSYNNESLDLLILDPDLPDGEGLTLLRSLEDRLPHLPMVIHTFEPAYLNPPALSGTVVLVEKEGTNIDRLKKVVSEILKESYPQRFESGGDIGPQRTDSIYGLKKT
ncbi:MAG: response regulator [Pseudomonadota bacterium]